MARCRCWKMFMLATLAVIATGDNDIPKQMKQLYKQHKRKGIDVNAQFNTVRYVSAHKGSTSSPSMLLFELDSLQKEDESLVKAELHFYRRPIEVTRTIQIDTFEISSYYVSLVQRQRLGPASKGWQVVNITNTVKQCTNTVTSNNKLGLAFTNVNTDLKTVPVNMTQFLRHHGLPFILLYSNNTRSLESDHITDRIKMSQPEMMRHLDSMVDPKTGKATTYNGVGSLGRERRSAMDNKIVIAQTVKSDRLFNTPPKEANGHLINADDMYNELTNKLEADKATNTNKKVNISSTGSPKETQTIAKPASQTIQYIPWPNSDNKKKRRKNKKGELLPPARTASNYLKRRKVKGCGRRSLKIHFDDIGWSERIIEPKKIDAYYCAGACSFPYSYGRQLTNHATLQSLITSIQSKRNIPQPCCVPDKLKPVTLMFYDENRNIVLKTYSDMSVESCTCR